MLELQQYYIFLLAASYSTSILGYSCELCKFLF